MPLAPGARLGTHEIVSLLGEGGMGEVYRATDTSLKRAVAIKVLPESVAKDADRLARFQREAEVLASLNHPHIAAIYGLERSGGVTALVMELVEGPTLADRIDDGAIPIDETFAIAKQIAEALEAAHNQGIVHRDLKPANIKVRPDGTVKVLDFGLAKALEPSGLAAAGAVSSPTITSPAMMTAGGVFLGTAAYMSPEQARGKAVDKRSDIWAFGAVLYEMLTGQRAFAGRGNRRRARRGADARTGLDAAAGRSPAWRRYAPPALPAQEIERNAFATSATRGSRSTASSTSPCRPHCPAYPPGHHGNGPSPWLLRPSPPHSSRGSPRGASGRRRKLRRSHASSTCCPKASSF